MMFFVLWLYIKDAMVIISFKAQTKLKQLGLFFKNCGGLGNWLRKRNSFKQNWPKK